MNGNKQKFLTDIHTHTSFSHDASGKMSSMLEKAQQLGAAFYGICEHFNYDLDENLYDLSVESVNEEEYFHAARHLQEDYQGVMNVLVGAEFGYGHFKNAHTRYALTIEKYHPDFIVNSVHCKDGVEYSSGKAFYKANGELIDKKTAYKQYLELVYQSLFAPYPYDIVAHIGYVSRYGPYENKEITYADFREEFDKILKTVIEKGKILEVNSKGLVGETTPKREILERYFELGGRKISYGSDAHEENGILWQRAETMKRLKEIGFTHVIVPFKGEEIKIEI